MYPPVTFKLNQMDVLVSGEVFNWYLKDVLVSGETLTYPIGPMLECPQQCPVLLNYETFIMWFMEQVLLCEESEMEA